MKRIRILASIDDGSALDMTLAEMLLRYRIPTVFYIPVKTRELMDNQLRKLAGTEPNCDICKYTKTLFELGAHSMTHPEDMKRLDNGRLRYEVEESKKGLEMIIGRPVTKFCYPSGRFNERVKEAVRRAGFREARTTKVLNTEFPKDPFQADPTVHIYPDRKEYRGLSWKEVAEELLEEVIKYGGRFEIWGHCFEFDKYHQWEFIEDFLYYLNKKMKEISYPRNINKELLA